MQASKKYKYLDNDSLLEAVNILSNRDKEINQIVEEIGPPPIWERPQGFDTLVRIILEQQVSLKSAAAVYNKLTATINPLSPQGFLQFSDTELKNFGFSRQKTSYCRNVANAILEGTLNLTELWNLDDDSVRDELIKIKGVGLWTANIYLLMVLKRPDIWPVGDIALGKSIQKIKNLNNKPTNNEMENISENWKPWRAVAARILWHNYLNNKKY